MALGVSNEVSKTDLRSLVFRACCVHSPTPRCQQTPLPPGSLPDHPCGFCSPSRLPGTQALQLPGYLPRARTHDRSPPSQGWHGAWRRWALTSHPWDARTRFPVSSHTPFLVAGDLPSISRRVFLEKLYEVGALPPAPETVTRKAESPAPVLNLAKSVSLECTRPRPPHACSSTCRSESHTVNVTRVPTGFPRV